MATHSSILARRVPWTEEPGELHTVHGVSKSQTRLRQLSIHTYSNQLYNTYIFQVLYKAF